MSFRARLLVTFLLSVLLPTIILALFIRHEMTNRLTAQYERRVESLVSVIEEDLAQESEAIAASLSVLRTAIVDDNGFRRAALDRAPEERRYLLDYAGNAMALTGLSMLQIQDASGRIVSSGHFRNAYDRMEPSLPRLLSAAPGGAALVRARTPESPFLALARADSFRLGTRRFTIVAGVRVERRFLARLARGTEMTVAVIPPGGAPDRDTPRRGTGSDVLLSRAGAGVDSARDDAIVRELRVPFIDPEHAALASARFRVSHRLAELHVLRASIDRWFLIAVAVTAVLSVILVSWIASRISRPLVELAGKTARVDLDRLDMDFDTGRTDEIGVLSRLLDAMTARLRASAAHIKDAERRATRGELARQVNHDVKNGLTPIRNVFRHLIQLSDTDPGRLPDVLRERRSTLDSSISYLENLASNYARLSPRSERRPCDVNDIVRRVVRDLGGTERAVLRTVLAERAVVSGDPVSLRRVLENLIDNAIDSLESRPGTVTVSTEVVTEESGPPCVRVAVTDTGVGMAEEQRARAFDDFFTTKDGGTGLGLSIVRRLVMDLDGTIRVESEKGKGSRFIVDLPVTEGA